jgi:hypothetical protein
MVKKIILFVCFLSINFYLFSQIDCGRPIFLPERVYFLRNDTMLRCDIYTTDNIIDSVKISNDIGIKISKRKWKFQNDNGAYSISKYKKVKKSEWLKNDSLKFLNADFQYKEKMQKIYNSNGQLWAIIYRFGRIMYIKRIIE